MPYTVATAAVHAVVAGCSDWTDPDSTTVIESIENLYRSESCSWIAIPGTSSSCPPFGGACSL